MKVSKHLHQLKLDFNIHAGPGKIISRFVNILIVEGETLSLIDTGVKGSETRIFDYLEEIGRKPEEISTVILSHSHPDHVGSAARIKALTGCRILAHRGEQRWIEDVELQERERPVPGFFNLVDQSVRIDEPVVDGQMLHLGATRAKVVHTPGHSAGLISLLFPDEGIFFTGDAIPLKLDIPNYDNYQELLVSLQKIRSVKDYSTMLTSWTPALRGNHEAEQLISEGENYLRLIDQTVKASYLGNEDFELQHCRRVAEALGLPPFLAMPVVDRAFRSHFTTGTFKE